MQRIGESNVYRLAIGNPTPFGEGKIDEVVQALLGIILEHGYELAAVLGGKEICLAGPNDFFQSLYLYEKEQGAAAVVRSFMEGVVVNAARKGRKAFTVATVLESPGSEEEKEKFAGMAEEWVLQNGLLSFVERFFRRPTLAQDPADRYLDNPLESCLKFVFGFAFQYRVTIAGWRRQELEEAMHEELARVLESP